MPKYRVEVEQLFGVTYIVEGENIADAWNNLMLNNIVDCYDQSPDRILSTVDTAYIVEDHDA